MLDNYTTVTSPADQNILINISFENFFNVGIRNKILLLVYVGMKLFVTTRLTDPLSGIVYVLTWILI